MVAGLSFFTSEWPNKNSRTKRSCGRPIFLDRLGVAQESIANPVDICRCAPRMNAPGAANLVHRRAIPAIRADEHRRINFAPEVLQEPGKQNNRARHVMRELAQEEPGLATVDEHQFREREVRRQPNFMRLLPAANFIEEARQTMNSAVSTSLAFARSQQRAILFRQTQTVNRPQKLSPHLNPGSFVPATDKWFRK